MKFTLNTRYSSLSDIIFGFITNFKSTGKEFVSGNRNAIKLFEIDGLTINIKSFKKPNFINKIVYRYFRKSKAQRSYEFANKLIENEIGTPQPIAFLENFDFFGLKDSYYVSEHLACDLTFRELVKVPEFPEHEIILRQFSQFCYLLHKKGVEFKDHSPGNTLIKKKSNGNYTFYLVDLNRMDFHQNMSFELRMKNLCRLTPKKEIIEVMANEYAKCSGESESAVFSTLWKYTSEFQHKFHRKKALKKKYLGK